jgi:hypothetical protein
MPTNDSSAIRVHQDAVLFRTAVDNLAYELVKRMARTSKRKGDICQRPDFAG